MKIEIILPNPEKTFPLYMTFAGQCNPQPAYVEINCEMHTIEADYDGEIGNAVPMRVFNRHALRFTVSAYLSNSDIEELLESVAPLAETVIEGYTSAWDGNNNVGRYTDEAIEAIEEIRHEYENFESSADIYIDEESGELVLS